MNFFFSFYNTKLFTIVFFILFILFSINFSHSAPICANASCVVAFNSTTSWSVPNGVNELESLLLVGGGGGGAGTQPADISGNDGANGGDGLYYGDIFGDQFGVNGYFAGGAGG